MCTTTTITSVLWMDDVTCLVSERAPQMRPTTHCRMNQQCNRRHAHHERIISHALRTIQVSSREFSRVSTCAQAARPCTRRLRPSPHGRCLCMDVARVLHDIARQPCSCDVVRVDTTLLSNALTKESIAPRRLATM